MLHLLAAHLKIAHNVLTQPGVAVDVLEQNNKKISLELKLTLCWVGPVPVQAPALVPLLGEVHWLLLDRGAAEGGRGHVPTGLLRDHEVDWTILDIILAVGVIAMDWLSLVEQVCLVLLEGLPLYRDVQRLVKILLSGQSSQRLVSLDWGGGEVLCKNK